MKQNAKYSRNVTSWNIGICCKQRPYYNRPIPDEDATWQMLTERGDANRYPGDLDPAYSDSLTQTS